MHTVRLLAVATSLVLLACQPAPTSGVVVASADEVRGAVADSATPVKVVKFWATWCASCLADMPGFIELATERPDDMELIFVSMDTEAQREEAEAVLAEHGWDARSFLRSGSDYAFMRTVTPRWTGALPATALYLSETDPAQFWEGQTDYETLSIRIDHLLAR
ncbi:MAG: TlpA disulfide reductase family protein [Bacteroidota bacterium]